MYVYMIGLKGFRYGFGFTSKVELFTVFTESEKLQHESNNQTPYGCTRIGVWVKR